MTLHTFRSEDHSLIHHSGKSSQLLGHGGLLLLVSSRVIQKKKKMFGKQTYISVSSADHSQIIRSLMSKQSIFLAIMDHHQPGITNATGKLASRVFYLLLITVYNEPVTTHES